ncbi:unnamed protein product [Protopolystoma xenopodis]|uniref:Uncharacterized protein n=1 Tax=Protopolystoma xenopodis TaxID=117903 RepID=A0A448XDP2_9PLAT|nr:unnamed protein product [Protopolystoma xenopodis]
MERAAYSFLSCIYFPFICILSRLFSLLSPVAIGIGARGSRWSTAVLAAQAVNRFMRGIRLLLCVIFTYPIKPKDNSLPVKVIIVHHRLSASSNSSHVILTLVEKMWLGIACQYNAAVIRLQRGSKQMRKFVTYCV